MEQNRITNALIFFWTNNERKNETNDIFPPKKVKAKIDYLY